MIQKYSKYIIYGIIAFVAIIISLLSFGGNKNEVKAGASVQAGLNNQCDDRHTTSNLGNHCHAWSNSGDDGGDGG